MKILIIGPLGAGKSSLAYQINKRFLIKRLNLDEIHRRKEDGSYYTKEEALLNLNNFVMSNSSWVIEGSQKYLYETLTPDLIVDMRINRLVAIWRFTNRFLKAKKLIGKDIDPNLPVQAYHYRKITLTKIRDYDITGQEINAEIEDYLKTIRIPVVKCKGFKDYPIIFEKIKNKTK